MELGLRTSEAAALGLTERDCAFALWLDLGVEDAAGR